MEYIKIFLNVCLETSVISEKMLVGIIKPLPRIKFGDIQTSDNYREVMISTNLYKLMEYCLLSQLQRKITLSHHQFAYRPNTSTLLAIRQ